VSERRVPSTAPPAPEAPIDPAVVDSLRRLGQRSGRNVLAELTSLFLSTADSQVDTARQLLARGELGELARVAHALKGSGSVIGGRRVATAAAALERASTTQVDTPDGRDCAGAALDRFVGELELFRAAARELDMSN
jgi:HPt (histidine-containing phosphotransfer) domain-containing protein